jgi:hypothetical protein
MLSTRWWDKVEDGRQASDLVVSHELRPDGTCVAYRLGVRSIGGRRLGSRLVTRCYDDGQVSVALEPPARER